MQTVVPYTSHLLSDLPGWRLSMVVGKTFLILRLPNNVVSAPESVVGTFSSSCSDVYHLGNTKNS